MLRKRHAQGGDGAAAVVALQTRTSCLRGSRPNGPPPASQPCPTRRRRLAERSELGPRFERGRSAGKSDRRGPRPPFRRLPAGPIPKGAPAFASDGRSRISRNPFYLGDPARRHASFPAWLDAGGTGPRPQRLCGEGRGSSGDIVRGRRWNFRGATIICGLVVKGARATAIRGTSKRAPNSLLIWTTGGDEQG